VYVPERRKVDNSLALAVLTVVMRRPMHPYEMASILRARVRRDETPIEWGSLYTVVRTLEKRGLLAEAEVAGDGAPDRTVYRVTDAGLREIGDLLSVPGPEQGDFETGLSIMGDLAPDEVVSLLRRRLGFLRERIAVARETLEREHGQVPRLFLVETEYALAISQAEETWTASLLAELVMGTFPGLDEWESRHQGRPGAQTAATA
jgi:DNA-binding PadR family transcriptional regulator